MAFLRSHGSLNVEMAPHGNKSHSVQIIRFKQRVMMDLLPGPSHHRAEIIYLPLAGHTETFSGHIYGAAVLQKKMVLTPNECVHNRSPTLPKSQYLNVDSRDLPFFQQRSTIIFNHRLLLGPKHEQNSS